MADKQHNSLTGADLHTPKAHGNSVHDATARDMANMTENTDAKVMTAAERTKVAGSPTKVGTTAADEFAVWTGDGTVEGQDVTEAKELVNVGTEDVEYSTLHDHIQTLQDVINHVWSAGVCASGFDITELGDGTIDITGGSAVLRSTNTPHGELNGYALDAVDDMTFTDEKTNYILADYNAGSPQLISTDDLAVVFGDRTKAIVYAVNRLGNDLNVIDFRSSNVDFIRKNNIKTAQVYGTEHASGAMISDEGSLEFSVTEGLFYLLNSSATTPALDTSGAGVFEYVYRNGSGGWTRVAAQSAIDNLYWDDGTGTLNTLGNNKYGAHFVYAVLNNPSHYKVVYGTEQYDSLAEAQAAGTPSILPSDLDALSTAEFIGKIVVEKGVTAFQDIQSPYVHALQSATATTHNALAGIQGGAVNDYYHMTAERLSTMFLNGYDRYNTDTMPDVTFTSGTRTIDVAVKGGQSSFGFWANNTKYLKTTTQSVVLPAVTGAYYTYFDSSGVLQYVLSSSATQDLFTKYAITSLTYWNNSDSSYLHNPDEMHGIDARGIWHMEHHMTEGATLHNGAEIEGLVSGEIDYTQSTASLGFDEDILHALAANSTGHVMLYRFGTDGAWRQTAADLEVGHIEGGDTYYSWNEKVGGTTWGWTEGTAQADYWITFYLWTPGGVVKMAGQNAYANRGAARDAIETEVDRIETDGLPMPETLWLGAVIVKRDGELQAMADGSVFYSLANRGSGSQSPSGTTSYAEDIPTDVSGFSGVLSGTDTNVQLALETIDSMPFELTVAVSDETTDLTTGTAKLTFRMPYAITLTEVRANVNTAPTGATIVVDINESGTTVLSTKLSIDASEKTSTTAATAPVISDSALADDAEITIDIDQIGSTIAGKGLKVTLIGTRA